MEEQQLLRDADIEPTSKVIAEGLGEKANEAYLMFTEAVKDYDLNLDWRYYNDGKA